MYIRYKPNFHIEGMYLIMSTGDLCFVCAFQTTKEESIDTFPLGLMYTVVKESIGGKKADGLS
jgi:membrane protein CcdC involved in cytochrome C biogenesis